MASTVWPQTIDGFVIKNRTSTHMASTVQPQTIDGFVIKKRTRFLSHLQISKTCARLEHSQPWGKSQPIDGLVIKKRTKYLSHLQIFKTCARLEHSQPWSKPNKPLGFDWSPLCDVLICLKTLFTRGCAH